MKHITCFIASLSSGGAEHQLSELAHMLIDNGYKITFVTFADVKDHYVLNKEINRVHICKNNNSIIKSLGVFLYFLKTKTDCIISFGQRENLLVLLPLLFRPKIKVIAGERNLTIGKQSNIEKILFKYLYKRANWIVPNSYSQNKYLLNNCPHYKNKIKTIINFTDYNKYTTCYNIHNNPLIIGVFSRYSKQKNYERFAFSIKKLKKASPIPFVIYWYGNQKFKDKMPNPEYLRFSKIIKDLQIEDVLKLNNHINNVHEVMARIDAFCLPSLYEGFSNSLSEAICCGKPIIASNVSDNPYMVKDGINGFLFNPYDVDDISNSLLKFLMLSEKEKKNFGIKSREFSIKIFNKDNFIKKYIEIIER